VLEDPTVNVRKILKRVFKKWEGDMDWINLAPERNRWRDLVNAVANS
jgi:hypothetical protein